MDPNKIHHCCVVKGLRVYLVYSRSTPSLLVPCGSWRSTRVGSCRPGCGSGCALLFPCPGSAPWSRPPRSSSCSGCRTRWRLSLPGRNPPSRGSGRNQWTAGWMKGRCWNNRIRYLQPKVRLREREKPNSWSVSGCGTLRTVACLIGRGDALQSGSSPSRGTGVRTEGGKTTRINETPIYVG